MGKGKLIHMNTIQFEQNKKPGLVAFGTENVAGNMGRSAMINASNMAKSFDKQPAGWLRLSSTKKFLEGLSGVKNIAVTELVKNIRKNNTNGFEKGVWIHEDAALEFARWLSPSFAIWNNQRTRELLLTGKTETIQTEEPMPVIASNILVNKVGELEEMMNEESRKAVYHDAVLQSQTLIPTTVIAKELGMSAVALNKMLHTKGIIYKNDTHWLLYAPYQGKGYTGTKTALYIDSQGKYQTNIHTYWTEKGREFIHEVIKETKQIA